MSDYTEAMISLAEMLPMEAGDPRIRAIANEVARLGKELAELQALEMNHEGACVRLKDEVARLTILAAKQLEALNAMGDDGSEVLREANEDAAFRRGTDAVLREALGDVMFSRLWGPELESLGRQMDRLRSERDAAFTVLRGLVGHADVEYAGDYASIEVRTEHWHAVRRVMAGETNHA